MRLAFAAAFTLLAGAAHAADTWDGVWDGGFGKGWPAVRLMFAGNELIGFFLNGDYLSDMRGDYSKNDGAVTITWTRGQATLTRDGPTTARLVVLQKGKPNATVVEVVAERE